MLINLTPHPIVIYPLNIDDEDNKIHDSNWIKQNCKIIPKSTEYQTAHLAEIEIGIFYVDDVIVERIQYGQLIAEQPPQEIGTYYIVSLATALAVRRSDFLVPYNLVRNIAGTVIGCQSLARPC